MPREEEDLVSHLDEGEDEEEPRDEDGDPQEEEAEPTRVGVGSQPQPQPKASKPRKKKVEQPKRGTIPKDADKSTEADVVWGRVIDELAEEGVDASMVKIKVSRVDHGSSNGVAIGYIPGDEVIGDGVSTTPADALMHAIEDIHTNSNTRGPQTYRVSFMLRGQPYKSGTIRLASIEEISMRRRGMGALPQQQQYGQSYGRAPLPPRPPPSPRGYDDRGYDDRYDDRRGDDRQRGRFRDARYDERYEPPRHADPEVQRLRDDMRDLKDTVKELVMGLGRPQPQQPRGLTLDLLSEAADALKKLGLHISPQQLERGLGAVMPQVASALPPPPSLQDDESQEFEKSITRKVRTAVNKKIDDAIGEVLNPRAKEEETPAPPVEEGPPQDAEDEDADWHAIPGVQWPNQQPMKYARDAETGQIDWGKTGLAAAPVLIEKLGPKVLEVAGKFADALKPRPAAQEEMQGEVVRREGVGSLNGGPQMASPQPPQQPPPPPPQDDDFKLS